MAMRAQLSLQFDDKELFEDFIIPYKEGRMLNNLIIKCLSAYYYNEEVRNLIEGTSMNDIVDGEDIQTNQSICDSIRASLMMQDFLASELQNTINNGMEDIDNILHQTNNVAKKSGVAESTESEYGSNLLRLSMKDASEVKERKQKSSNILNDTSLDLILSAILKLAEASGNKEVVDMLSVDSTLEIDNDEEISSLQQNNEVFTETEQLVEEIDEPTIEEDYIVKDSIPTVNDFDEEPAIVSPSDNSEIYTDASDAIADLLGSL